MILIFILEVFFLEMCLPNFLNPLISGKKNVKGF